MHHIKLNIHYSIYFESGSRTSIFTMSGVTINGPDEVEILRNLFWDFDNTNPVGCVLGSHVHSSRSKDNAKFLVRL